MKRKGKKHAQDEALPDVMEIMSRPQVTGIVERYSAPSLKQAIAQVLGIRTKGNSESELAIIIRKQIQKAKAGDRHAAEFLLNRAYGLPTATIENINPPMQALQIQIVNVPAQPQHGGNGHSKNGKA